MDPRPLYQRIAEHYRRAIHQGVLAAGSRLPSVRSLMRWHGISLSTALQACRELESEGLVQAKARSGYFVLRPERLRLPSVREPDTSRTPEHASDTGMHDRVSAFVTQSERYPCSVDFAGGVAASHLYPVDLLRRSMARALRSHAQVLVQPVPRQGHPFFRAVLARRALAQGVNASADDIIVTHGCVEALNLALRAVAMPGDTIAVESPAYYGLLQILESLGMRALEIPTSPQSGISVDALDLAFQAYPCIKAVVVVPNRHNPLGCVMPDSEKARLVALCERQGVAVIEDDTYGLLADNAVAPAALKAWDATGNVIFCASLHKTVAPGMRLGWMIGGRWHARVTMLKYVQSRPNEPLAQLAVAEFMESSAYDRHLARLCHHLKRQREQMAQAIAVHFPSGTRMNMPGGGMFLWIELPDGRSAQDMFELGLKEGIRIIPGSMFSGTGRFDHCVRISCGEPFTAKLEHAVRTLAATISNERDGRPGSAVAAQRVGSRPQGQMAGSGSRA